MKKFIVITMLISTFVTTLIAKNSLNEKFVREYYGELAEGYELACETTGMSNRVCKNIGLFQAAYPGYRSVLTREAVKKIEYYQKNDPEALTVELGKMCISLFTVNVSMVNLRKLSEKEYETANYFLIDKYKISASALIKTTAEVMRMLGCKTK